MASDMYLYTHSDASHMLFIRSRSRAGSHIFLSSKPTPGTPPATFPTSGLIHVIAKIMKFVMGSAAESEIGTGYITAQKIIPMRTWLIEMGHRQPPTPIQVDNTIAVGFVNKTIKQKKPKAIDMRFY